MSIPRKLAAVALAAAIGAGLAGCGDDDGAAVRDGGGSASGTGGGSASGVESGSGSSTEEGAACSPVGEDLEADADETVDVTQTEYAFVPSDITVAAGVVTFVATNDGTENHELGFLPGGGDVPLTDDGAPDEAALEDAGAFELTPIAPGESCNATFELDAGTYTIFCLVQADDGQTHAAKGMTGTLTVE